MSARKLVFAAITLLLLAVAGCTSNTQSAGGQGGSFVFVSPGGKTDFSYPEAERQTIGDFVGTSVTDENTTIKLSDYPDTAIVINFWGSWCGPCRAEAPDLNVAAELSADRPVQFLGINVQDSREGAADFMAGKQVTFPSIFDPTMATLLSMQGYPTTGIPSTIILDRQHRVAQIFLGAITAQQLDESIAAIVGGPATGSDPAVVGATSQAPESDATPTATSGPTR